MINRNQARIAATVACLCVALLLPATASAQDAKQYLDKMLTMYDSPFRADYTMTMKMNQGGMALSMNGTGKMTWADETHMMMDVDMSMMMPGTDQSMKMSMKTVADGTTTWTEMNNPMMGQQVMKMDIARAQAMAEEQGMSNNPGQSPFEQIRSLQQYFDFKVTDKSGGKVRLEGAINDSAPAQMKEAGPMIEGLVLVLAEGTSQLESFEMGPIGEPAMVMNVSSYTKLKPTDVPFSLFAYTPPEGVTVVDPLALQQ